MSDWKIVKKIEEGSSEWAHFLTAGLLDHFMPHWYMYIVEDEDGNEKTVKAFDEKDLGEKISEGDFEEIED